MRNNNPWLGETLIADFGELLRALGGTALIHLSLLGGALIIVFSQGSRVLWMGRVFASSYLQRLEEVLKSNTLEQSIRMTEQRASAAVPRVALAALNSALTRVGSVQRAAALELSALEVQLNKHKRILPALAQLAVLIGLIATITEMSRTSFTPVGMTAGPEERQYLLMMRISRAMAPTAMGLLIALFCVVSQALIQGTIRKLLNGAELVAKRVPEMLRLRTEWVGELSKKDASKVPPQIPTANAHGMHS